MSGQAKPQLRVGDATMLDRVLTAVSGAGARIVVGPPQPVPAGVVIVQEQPAGSGPVAGAAAGLAEVSAEIVVLLAVDLPFLTAELIQTLVGALGADDEVAVLIDEAGRDQFLLSAWRASALRRSLTELAPLAGRAMRDVVAAVRVTRVEVATPRDGPAPWTDVDTPADLDCARGHVQP